MNKKKKDWKDALGQMVFSTHSEENRNDLFEGADTESDLDLSQYEVRIWLDRKGRRGKAVTSIRGIETSLEELEALARELKKLCGVGGSVKEGEIIIQGDQRNKVRDLLIKKGYSNTKLAGS